MPQKPGVYLFFNQNGDILYVGKAKNLKERVSSYFTNANSLGEKTKLLVSNIEKIKTILVESELDALLLEANLIKKYSPKFNIRFTDGKAYPLIRITIKDIVPKILISRNTTDPKSVYFGPYPNAGAVKTVLKTIRKIFPYEAVWHHPKKLCLYNYLGLCPCVEHFGSIESKRDYKKTVKYIVQFLSGRRKSVSRELEKSRDFYSRNENFEQAFVIQKQIDAIKYITNATHHQFDYEINPNLLSDIRGEELEDIKTVLKKYGTSVLNLHRIECFDISTIQGKSSTGSMVVFVNGEKESSLYRRFKVRFNSGKPNDFAMMEEVLKRRFKHSEWEYPNLLIVDGGKGQVSVAKKALASVGVSIPIIGLAKREETIITSDFKEIRLPKDSSALHLLMRIRDEAHRFAITYHRKLRQKYSLL